jgi:hypothetical protein
MVAPCVTAHPELRLSHMKLTIKSLVYLVVVHLAQAAAQLRQ